VGDQLRFGESSRIYILTGPAELMPEEGPSREDRMKQAALKVGPGGDVGALDAHMGVCC
jgi:hypothetical protein